MPESYQWDHLSRLSDQSMGQILVVLDEISYVDIAVVPLEQRIFPQLVSEPSVNTSGFFGAWDRACAYL